MQTENGGTQVNLQLLPSKLVSEEQVIIIPFLLNDIQSSLVA